MNRDLLPLVSFIHPEFLLILIVNLISSKLSFILCSPFAFYLVLPIVLLLVM